MNTEYHKIKSLYKRDMDGTKKLVEGFYADSLVEYLADNQWIFTEKVDGTNIRVVWDGHKVEFFGRTDKAQIPVHLVTKLISLFYGEENAQIFEQLFGEKEAVIYGEGYGPKIQAGGGLYSSEAQFIAFDVKVSDIFLEREAAEVIAEALNIPMVPIVLVGSIKEAVSYVKSKPLSQVAEQEREMEGLVGVPARRIYDVMGNRVIVKIKGCDFD
jgi:ATP-dependent RNA circularization protein (DNA/RNA ligase family)